MLFALVDLRQGITQIRQYIPLRAALLGSVIHRADGEWTVQRVIGQMPRGFLRRQREPMMRA